MSDSTDVVIVGAGGFGREIYQWLPTCSTNGASYRVRGFLDGALVGQTVHDLPVLGDLDWLEQHREVAAVVAVGSPATRRRLLERLRGWGIALPAVVDPGARVGRNVEVGEGSVICAGTLCTCDIKIGRGVILNLAVTVGHDATIGDVCTLAPGINVSGHVHISEGCDLGTGAALIPSVTVGEWSVVGAGAVVAADLPANVVAVGVPARAIKTRTSGWHLQ